MVNQLKTKQRMFSVKKTIICTLMCVLAVLARAQQLYEIPNGVQTRWISFENPQGEKGGGGVENKGAKGRPSIWVNPGDTVTLMDYAGCGTIHRIWMTVIERSPVALRSLSIQMFWDHAKKPAVSVPLSDFFGVSLGRMAAFESALFASPEGRSFNSYVPMPFRTHARIQVINEGKQKQLLFYDVNCTVLKKHPKGMAYFHAFWHRSDRQPLASDFEILPLVHGKGRFLGTNIGVMADTVYQNTWFGEGEVKMYLDGDTDHATLVGSGTEDYIGSAWNLGPFAQQYQGATVVDKTRQQFAFYRYHIPDPIYFQQDCRVTIQEMGGAGRDVIREILRKGGQAKPVSVMTASKGLIPLLEERNFPTLDEEAFPKDEWVNFYRVDDYTATAYFYLDKPETNLPALPPLEARLKNIK